MGIVKSKCKEQDKISGKCVFRELSVDARKQHTRRIITCKQSG